MIKINPESINDLLVLKDAGVPVTLTSHPGNASLYKLVLWSCGIPDHLWDVTCCKADANNWPMYRLVNGKAELLVSEDMRAEILRNTRADNRYVTAYQFTTDGIRLGRFHVKAKQVCFPNAISSCSRLLLSEKEKVWEMFDYLARTRRDEVFARCITPSGILRPLRGASIATEHLATSFIDVLGELDRLLFSDETISVSGGACYDGVMVPLSVMLVQFWQTGQTDRYDVSGPDMLHYALCSEHQVKLSLMLEHLRKWRPSLIPKNILIHMFPGTAACVGYIRNHPSEEIMRRKVFMLRSSDTLSGNKKREIWEIAKEDERRWPTKIRPVIDKYFSQHDLASLGNELVVDDFWRDMPFSVITKTLSRANNLLRL